MRKILLIPLILVVLSGCTNKPDFEFTIETKNDLKEEEIVETPIVKADNAVVTLNSIQSPESPAPKILDPSTITVRGEQVQDDNGENSKQKIEVGVKDKDLGVNIDWPVPFAMQAPFSNWEMPYQEMCEEAAIVLAAKYYNDEPLDKTIMEQELKNIRDWESNEWGIYTDSTAAEIKKMGEAIYKLDIEISEDVSIKNIKDNLKNNHLVLVPTAGRELGNPYFKQPGPLYHILVLRGFTDNSFIANDVGIGKGEGYQYKFQTVMNAAHDLPVLEDGTVFRPFDTDISDDLKREEMKTGTPRILIVKGKK